jgi:hypothetical protein
MLVSWPIYRCTHFFKQNDQEIRGILAKVGWFVYGYCWFYCYKSICCVVFKGWLVLDVKDPLIQLANTINWTVFDDAFEQHYSQTSLMSVLFCSLSATLITNTSVATQTISICCVVFKGWLVKSQFINIGVTKKQLFFSNVKTLKRL